MFGEEVGVILQVDRNATHRRTRNYRSDWSPAGRIRSDSPEAHELTLPHNPDGLLEAARRIGSRIPSGFVRVDLFEDPVSHRPVLGELCLIPGGDLYFRKGLDRELGALWNEADVRLLGRQQTIVP